MSDRAEPGAALSRRARAGTPTRPVAAVYDHDSFRTLDWIEVAVDQVVGDAERCRRRAAMLEGAADALLELAERQHEGAVLWEVPAP